MTVRRRFLFALMASLALHLSFVAGPAWLWPGLEEWLAPALVPAEPLAVRLVPRSMPTVKARRPAERGQVRQRVARGVRAKPEPELTPVPVHPIAAAPAVAVPEQMAVAPAAEPEAQVPAPPAEFLLPRQVRIRYRVTMGDAGLLVGQAEHDWTHDGSHYRLRSTAETIGLAALVKSARVVHESAGDIENGMLRPREFRSERNGVPAEWARFDWEAGHLRMSGGPGGKELEPGTQDMLSMFAQLAVTPFDGSVYLWVATGKKVEAYDFAVVAEEPVRAMEEEWAAVRLRTRRGDQEMTEVWLALGLARLPVRIRHVDRRGNVFDQVAESIEIDGKTEGRR